MRELKKTISAKIFNWDELSDLHKDLLFRAATVRKNAQAPYSGFFVGVSVLTKGGSIYAGCNVERATYTQTTHAEQNSIDTAVAQLGSSKARVSKLALALGPKQSEIEFPPKLTGKPVEKLEEIIVPCGHCLQTIWENCMKDGSVEIITLLPNGEISLTTMDSAFPIKFGPADLGVDYTKEEK